MDKEKKIKILKIKFNKLRWIQTQTLPCFRNIGQDTNKPTQQAHVPMFVSENRHSKQRGSPYLQVGSQVWGVVRFPGQRNKWKTHKVRTPPRSDSGEATPQSHQRETVLLQIARGFLFKSALWPTVIHHAGVEDRGAPSSWVRGYLKEKTTTQGGGKGVVGKYQKYQLRVTRKYKVTGVTRNTW